jgi:hypothetical protein
MHAVVYSVTIHDRTAAEAELENLVPPIESLPGFVAGYWVSRSADAGIAMVIFDSEEAAEELARFLESAPDAAGMTLDRQQIDVGPVWKHA